MTVEAQTAVVHLHAEGHQGLLAPAEPPGGTNPADTLTSDSWLLNY